MPSIDVCLSPNLIDLHSLDGKVAVVVDILRATSCMTAGIASGIKTITPFDNLDSCLAMRKSGYLIAGERNGQKVEGFDLGNSPFDYMESQFKGHHVAVTTTNGTVAIERSRKADHVIIGSFLNISAVASWIRRMNKDVLIVCAGWKGKVNLEDTLFAGALTAELMPDFALECDAPLVAKSTYERMKDDLAGHVYSSSHAKRLRKLNIHRDIEYCLSLNEFDVVPELINGTLKNSAS